MKRHNHHIAIMGSAALIGLCSSAARVESAGTAFTYQGEVIDAGTPVTGDCDFEFTLWDAPSGGVQVGPTVARAVAVTDGVFSEALDFGEAAYDGSARWLQIGVCCPSACDATSNLLSPRQELTPVPYAVRASGGGTADGHSLDGDQGGPINAVYVDADGKVGIGTTAPDAQLHLQQGEIWIGGVNTLGGLPPSAGAGIRMFNGLNDGVSRIFSWDYVSNSARDLSLQLPGGNVGIGTGTPSERLSVVGTIESTTGGFRFPDGTLQTTAASGGGAANTLDEAYDQGGAGAGRTITADAGAVEIQGTGGLVVAGTIQSGNSIIIDGVSDTITAISGLIDFDDENLRTTGRVEASSIRFDDGTTQFTAPDFSEIDAVTLEGNTAQDLLDLAAAGQPVPLGGDIPVESFTLSGVAQNQVGFTLNGSRFSLEQGVSFLGAGQSPDCPFGAGNISCTTPGGGLTFGRLALRRSVNPATSSAFLDEFERIASGGATGNQTADILLELGPESLLMTLAGVTLVSVDHTLPTTGFEDRYVEEIELEFGQIALSGSLTATGPDQEPGNGSISVPSLGSLIASIPSISADMTTDGGIVVVYGDLELRRVTGGSFLQAIWPWWLDNLQTGGPEPDVTVATFDRRGDPAGDYLFTSCFPRKIQGLTMVPHPDSRNGGSTIGIEQIELDCDTWVRTNPTP